MSDQFEQDHPRGAAGKFVEASRVDPGGAAIGADWRTTTAVRTLDEQDDDGLRTCTQDTLRGDAEFQRRCRRILGVRDDSRPVIVVHSTEESSPWGCDTWEFTEDVTVSCGGRTLRVADVPELFRRLDAADLPRMDNAAARALYASAQRITVRLRNGDTVSGRVVNCNEWKVVIDDGAFRTFTFADIIGFEHQEGRR